MFKLKHNNFLCVNINLNLKEGGFLATNLKKVTVPVVSDADCNQVGKN